MTVAAQVSRGGGGRLGDFLESTLAACALISEPLPLGVQAGCREQGKLMKLPLK